MYLSANELAGVKGQELPPLRLSDWSVCANSSKSSLTVSEPYEWIVIINNNKTLIINN